MQLRQMPQSPKRVLFNGCAKETLDREKFFETH